ncbi:hypothetical protein [Persephonella sp.]
MKKNLTVNLELFVLESQITTESIRKSDEFDLKKSQFIGSLNKIPAYKFKLKSEDGMLIAQITKILTETESDSIKEKFYI